MAAYVGIDPKRDINFVTHPVSDSIQLLAERKIDALMGFPPDPQELREKKIGHVIVNSGLDRPWSQYFCCIVASNQEFVRRHPLATKRALRAIIKAANFCAAEPERAARLVADKGYRYDYSLQTMHEIRYAQVPCQFQLSRRNLDQAAEGYRQGRVASRRTLSPRRLHRDEHEPPGRARGRLLQQARHVRAMDQGGQRRDQVDATVVPNVRRQRGAAPASCPRLQPRQFPAHAGDAGADQGLVADDLEGQADQDRREGGAPRPLCYLPDGPRSPSHGKCSKRFCG